MRCLCVVAVALICSACWAGDKVRIVIEAESAAKIVSPLVVSDLEDASGGKCVKVPTGRNAGVPEPAPNARASFRVRIPPDGTYRVWGRWQVRGAICNAHWMTVDVDEVGPEADIISASAYAPLRWSKAKRTHALTAGEHTIRVHRFATGVEFDQILITNDIRYMPSRAMKETPEYVVPPEPD